MILGNGLIANSFKKYSNEIEDYLIFASGVSNSKSQDLKDYARELEMINSCISHDKIFIYFSTCSIYDQSLQATEYILHKKRIEKLIEQLFKRYLIVRLPIVIGYSSNPNTLFNYLSDKIQNDSVIDVYSDATRFIIDSEDVSYWTLQFLMQGNFNTSLNMGYPQKFSIINIINAFENLFGKRATINLKQQGDSYNVDFSVFSNFINQQQKAFSDSPSYLKEVLRKYYSNAK